MKKLAIFDMDGTLFNTEDVNYYAYNKALEEKGFSLDYEYYCKYCNGRYYKEFIPNLVKHDNEIVEYVHNRKKEVYHEFLDKAKVNFHLFHLIELMRPHYHIALVTTASKENTNEILQYFHKYHLFDLILTHNDISKPKPAPEGFLKAIEHFDCSPTDTIIFEDSEVGVTAARATGANLYIVDRF